MTALTLILLFKIVVTAALVALPFLFAPVARLQKATGLTGPSAGVFRLYGIAISALLVGYAFGIPPAEASMFPTGVVWMGLVSNGGAAAYLLASGGASRQKPLIGFLLLVTALLLMAVITPAAVVVPLF